MKRAWPLAVGIACVALVALALLRPNGRPIGWRQASEGRGYRNDEYGAFGVTLFQPVRAVPGLDVGGDFRAALAQTGLKNPPVVEAHTDDAARTIRRGGTQYWLNVNVHAKPKDVIDAYVRQLKGGGSHPMPSSGSMVSGLCPDGKTPVRIYAASLGSGLTNVSVTFGSGV